MDISQSKWVNSLMESLKKDSVSEISSMAKSLNGQKLGDWKFFFEYPGWFAWYHDDYENFVVAATPWSDNDKEISVQITKDGEFLKGFDVPFPEGSSDKDYLRVMKNALQKALNIIEKEQ